MTHVDGASSKPWHPLSRRKLLGHGRCIWLLSASVGYELYEYLEVLIKSWEPGNCQRLSAGQLTVTTVPTPPTLRVNLIRNGGARVEESVLGNATG